MELVGRAPVVGEEQQPDPHLRDERRLGQREGVGRDGSRPPRRRQYAVAADQGRERADADHDPADDLVHAGHAASLAELYGDARREDVPRVSR